MTSINGPLPFDQAAAKTFLSLLGKPPHETRLRGFLPSGHTLKSTDTGRKSTFSSAAVTSWQQEGRGVYTVINNGGDTDAQITSCNALFCEWDDRDVSWQITAWRELNLPEPSFIVLTGGKSAHLYWRFTAPIPVDTWRDLQTRLLEYADADRTLKNPSRVMRLPGAWHLGPDGKANSQTVILGQPSGRSYTVEAFDQILPSPQVVTEQAQARAYRLPLDFPSHSLSQIQDALQHIPQAIPNQKQYPFYRNLMWGLIRACEEAGGTADDAIAFMSAHSPRFAEVRQVARSAFSHVNASTFWYWAQHHGYKSSKATEPFDAYSSAQRKADAQEAAEAAELSYTDLIDLLVEAYRVSDLNAEVELTAQIKTRFKRSDGQIISAVMRALTPQSTSSDTATVDLDLVHSLEYAADGWIIANKPQLLYASYGGGKTTLIVEKAIAICEGRSLIERRTITHQPGAALIIATDSGLQALKTTIQQLQYDDHPALDSANPRLFLWGQCTEQGMNAWVADVPGILKLRRFVEQHGIKYVAVDSVKTVCAGGGFSYLDNDAVNNFIALIDRTICEPLNCCVEFVSHTGTEKGSHSGAKAWAEAPSMVCRLTPAYDETSADGGQNVERNRIGVKAEFLKDRASMDGQRVITYLLREAQGLLEPLSDVELVGSCREAITAALRAAREAGRDGMRLGDLQTQIAGKHGRSAKTVANTLSAMCAGASPAVVRPKGMRGIYALADPTAVLEQDSRVSADNSLSIGGDSFLSFGIKDPRSTATTEKNDSEETPDLSRLKNHSPKSQFTTESTNSQTPPDSSRRLLPNSHELLPPPEGMDLRACAPAPARALYVDHSASHPLDYDPAAEFPF